MQTHDRKIVVIAPIRNEQWILTEFLKATSTFADLIVIGDHNSTDESRSIARAFPKVVLFESKMEKFSERERRNELLIEARKHALESVILSLDADEFITPNFITNDNLTLLRQLTPGTRIRLPFFNVRPDLTSYWVVPQDPIGFVDDGSMHEHGENIHFPRIPERIDAPIFQLDNAGLLHLQFIDWSRMESKHRWYRAWERVNFPRKHPLSIARRYSHMYAVPKNKIRQLPKTWLDHYEDLGVKFGDLSKRKESYWWDSETIKLIEIHGAEKFRYVDLAPLSPRIIDSRRAPIFWNYLRVTTPWTGKGKYSPLRLLVRLVDEVIKYLWV
jgi:glycosyltransferase involved in cell wall biosynthesis